MLLSVGVSLKRNCGSGSQIVARANDGKKLGLLHRVDAQITFELVIGVKLGQGITRFVGKDGGDFGCEGR